jgi:hypothetical protein
MKFVTFLNSGCIDFCKNMLFSAQKVGINLSDFYIACLDKKSFEEIGKYIPNTFIYTDCNISSYRCWSEKINTEFRQIMKHKFLIVKKIYEKHKNLCYLDTDIVFLKNPIQILKDKSNILFQSDLPGLPLCAGFFVLNDSKRCNDFMNDKELEEMIKNYSSNGDQIIFNIIADKKYRDCIEILSEEKFPNGHVFYEKNIKDKAYIVHNNWIVGKKLKIQYMKNNNLWFLNENF